MNKRIKTSWIKRLLSGKYKQGKGSLRDGDKFCCLGVLCEIARERKVVKAERVGVDGEWRFSGELAYLPVEVREWAGAGSGGDINITLDKRDAQRLKKRIDPKGINPKGREYTSLAQLNDAGASFKTIARLIGKYL
jgi:hypothetical protein